MAVAAQSPSSPAAAKSLTIFTESPHCLSHAHCAWCRDLDRGRDFRKALAKTHVLPDGAPDFPCPHGFAWGDTPPPVPPDELQEVGVIIVQPGQATAEELARWKEKKDIAGRAHWRELHTKANPSPEWWSDWLERIPAFGCSCKQSFADILAAAAPPPFADLAAFRRWGWARHNDVRRKLGQDELDYPAAAALYGWDVI